HQGDPPVRHRSRSTSGGVPSRRRRATRPDLTCATAQIGAIARTGTFAPTDAPAAPGILRDAMEIDRNGLEVLGREECMRLLASASLGRLGITTGALPTVLPVNFRLVGDQIVFRTGSGTKLDAATDNAVVAFEVDDMDPVWHTGWSVVVTGMAREV